MTTSFHNDPQMTFFEHVAALPVEVESYETKRRERETSSGFTRASTTVVLHGSGETGKGEDVTYDLDEHDPAAFPTDLDLATSGTFGAISEGLDDHDLFPAGTPERDVFRNYRRWAFESALLDLALRQNDTHLGARFDREYDPVRFVVSTRLGDPPTADRVHEWLAIDPDMEFKLDAAPDWGDDLLAELAETGRIRVFDLKALYADIEVANEIDPAFYRQLFETFPEAVIEDAGLTEGTEPILREVRDRLSWDEPINGVEDLHDLPFEPSWCNVKPSRFGTVESLLSTIEYCLENGIRMYGGGQFELGVGRGQIQLLASLFYPDGPNDVAPAAYNDPEPREDLPSSPLTPPGDPRGFRWE